MRNKRVKLTLTMLILSSCGALTEPPPEDVFCISESRDGGPPNPDEFVDDRSFCLGTAAQLDYFLDNYADYDVYSRIQLLNDQITQEDFERLSKVQADEVYSIGFTQTPNITNLKGFSGIKKIWDLSLDENSGTSLESLDGLDSLEQIRAIVINNASSLKRVELPPNVVIDEETDIGAEFYGINLQNNANLEVVRGFEGFVGGNTVTLANNPKLREVRGFNNLKAVGQVFIGINAELETVEGFGSLTTIDSRLVIAANPNLTSIPDLSFEPLDEEVGCGIYDNASLPNCQAEAICAPYSNLSSDFYRVDGNDETAVCE